MKEKRILIAEDDISTGILLPEFLTPKGYLAETVKDGSEALRRYKENPSQVVITDNNMPDMDGFDTTRRIGDMQPDVLKHQIPAVAMTALAVKIGRAFIEDMLFQVILVH